LTESSLKRGRSLTQESAQAYTEIERRKELAKLEEQELLLARQRLQLQKELLNFEKEQRAQSGKTLVTN
jgi:hypothetical protein